jgi:hypothetical protein
MPKKPVSIEVVQEGDERFLVKTYADGETVRESIVKLPRRKRYPDRPYWRWNFDKTRKKGFWKLALRLLGRTSPANFWRRMVSSNFIDDLKKQLPNGK